VRDKGMEMNYYVMKRRKRGADKGGEVIVSLFEGVG
jgi:hypothetical protein